MAYGFNKRETEMWDRRYQRLQKQAKLRDNKLKAVQQAKQRSQEENLTSDESVMRVLKARAEAMTANFGAVYGRGLTEIPLKNLTGKEWGDPANKFTLPEKEEEFVGHRFSWNDLCSRCGLKWIDGFKQGTLSSPCPAGKMEWRNTQDQRSQDIVALYQRQTGLMIGPFADEADKEMQALNQEVKEIQAKIDADMKKPKTKLRTGGRIPKRENAWLRDAAEKGPWRETSELAVPSSLAEKMQIGEDTQFAQVREGISSWLRGRNLTLMQAQDILNIVGRSIDGATINFQLVDTNGDPVASVTRAYLEPKETNKPVIENESPVPEKGHKRKMRGFDK